MENEKKFALEVIYRGQVLYRGIIQNTPITLGRSKDCDIPFEKMDFLSRKHIEIFYQHPNYYFRDLNSSNGVFQNKKRISQGVIEEGQSINVGELSLNFKEVSLKQKEAEKLKQKSNNLDKTITEISLHGTLNDAIELEVMFEGMKEELGTEPGIELIDDTDSIKD